MACRVLNWNLAVALQDRSQGVDDGPLETQAPHAWAAGEETKCNVLPAEAEDKEEAVILL